MKAKYQLSLLFVICYLLFSVSATAQSIHFGVKGGVNNSEFNLDDVPTKSGYGWFVGPTLKVNILSFLGVQGAVLYSQSNSKVDGTNIKQKSILVPIDARLNLHLLPKFGLFLSTGPQFGFNTDDKDFNIFASGDRHDEVVNNYKETFQLKESMFSWNFGAGVMLSKHLELGIVYTVGITKTGDLKNVKKDDKANSKGWMASATYFF